MVISRRLTRLIIITLITVVYLAGCGNQKKEVRLAYRFPLDKIYHFVYESKMKVSVYENGALSRSEDRTSRISYTQEVVELIDDTGARLRFSYIMTEENIIGSPAEDKEKTAQKWSSECIMTSRGKIIDFFPDSSISKESVEYYRKLFEQTSPMYPEGLIPEGYTWNNTFKVLLDVGMTDALTTYKVKSFVREAGYNCAVIEYKGNMVIPLAESCSVDSSVSISGADRIKVEGVAYFAYSEGITIREEEKSILVREGTQIKDSKTTAFRIEEKRNTLTRLVEIERQ